MPGTRSPIIHLATRTLALAAIVLMLAGCSRIDEGASPLVSTPLAEPSNTAKSSSSSPSSSEAATINRAQFWATIGGGSEMAESFETLDELSRATDVAVVANVLDLREGRTISFPETGETMYMAEVRLQVETTIRGNVASPPSEPGVLVIETSFLGFSPNPNLLAEMANSAPKGSRVLLFLVNNEADANRHGSPAHAPYRGPGYFYSLPHGVQAVIRDESGTAAISEGAKEIVWLAALDGRPFEQVVGSIGEEVPLAR